MLSRKERLDTFIKLVYGGNKSDLMRAVNEITGEEFTRQNFSVHINKETVSQPIMDALHKLGLNIIWYLYHEGGMFNNTEAGQKLREEFDMFRAEINGDRDRQLNIVDNNYLGKAAATPPLNH